MSDNYENFLEDYVEKNNNPNNNQSNSTTTPNQTINYSNINSNSNQTTNGYIGFAAKMLPNGEHYPEGTMVYIRGAETEELQAYSLVDDTNMYDIIDKMNNILSSCVRIKYIDGSMGTYLDLKDGDRYFLIYEIRDLTFPNKNDLYVPITCTCGKQTNTPIRRNNMVFHESDEELMEYFDNQSKMFIFEKEDGNIIKLRIPSIGLYKSFYSYLIDKTKASKNTSQLKQELSFIKTIPYLVVDKNTLTTSEIDKLITNYKNMDKEEFLLIDEITNRLKYGIHKLKNTCEHCGMEAQEEFNFPYGASRIFTVENVLSKLVKRKK